MAQSPIDHDPIDPTPAGNGNTSFLTPIFWSILGITTLLHLVYALKLPLTGDEAYFWEWGRHPALGYYDHPPVAGWILWLTRQLFGDTLTAVRLPAVLAGTLVVALIHRLAMDITGSARSAALTGLLAMGVPVINALGVLYTTDTPVLAAGTLGGYFLFRAVHRDDKRAWILTGVCFAIVLGSKFLGVPLLGAAALYLVLNPGARRHLKTAGPYVAGSLSLLGMVPVVLWNAANHWATFTFNFASRHSASSPSLKSVLDYLVGQAVALSPMVFLLAIPLIGAAVPIWREKGEEGRRFAAFLALGPLGGFLILSLVTRVGAHWPGVAVPFLMVALGSKLCRGSGISRTYFATAATAWFMTLLLFMIPLVPYLLPSDWAYPLRPEKINTAQLKKIMGSPSRTGEIAGEVIQGMDREGQVFVFTRSYALSSLLAFYAPRHPEVTVLGKGSVHGRNHLLWFDPARHKGMDAVFVTQKTPSAERDFIEERFESWEAAIVADGPEGSMVSVIKCYGYKGIR